MVLWINEYNNQYNIEFKNNHDSSLLELKNSLLFKFINNLLLKKTGLTINGVTYKNLTDLDQNMLISSIGEKYQKSIEVQALI